MPTRYESQAACSAATSATLAANTGFDFPSLLAECQSMARPASASRDEQQRAPDSALRG